MSDNNEYISNQRVESAVEELRKLSDAGLEPEQFKRVEEIVNSIHPELPQKYQQELNQRLMSLAEVGERPAYTGGFSGWLKRAIQGEQEVFNDKTLAAEYVDAIADMYEEYLGDNRYGE